MAVLWHVAPGSLVGTDRCSQDFTALFNRVVKLHVPLKRGLISTRLHGATFQKTVIFMLKFDKTRHKDIRMIKGAEKQIFMIKL